MKNVTVNPSNIIPTYSGRKRPNQPYAYLPAFTTTAGAIVFNLKALMMMNLNDDEGITYISDYKVKNAAGREEICSVIAITKEPSIKVGKYVWHKAYVGAKSGKCTNKKYASKIREQFDAQDGVYFQLIATDQAGIYRVERITEPNLDEGKDVMIILSE